MTAILLLCAHIRTHTTIVFQWRLHNCVVVNVTVKSVAVRPGREVVSGNGNWWCGVGFVCEDVPQASPSSVPSWMAPAVVQDVIGL